MCREKKATCHGAEKRRGRFVWGAPWGVRVQWDGAGGRKWRKEGTEWTQDVGNRHHSKRGQTGQHLSGHAFTNNTSAAQGSGKVRTEQLNRLYVSLCVCDVHLQMCARLCTRPNETEKVRHGERGGKHGPLVFLQRLCWSCCKWKVLKATSTFSHP